MLFSLCANSQISVSMGDTLATLLTGPEHPLTISVLGDSYVKNHRRPFEETWHFKAAYKAGMNYLNYGRNGGCVAFDRTKEGFGPSLMERYQELEPNSDIVVIIAGHNDAVKIGKSKELLLAFADSALILIDRIHAQCPHASVGWVTPWFVDEPGFKEVCKTIKAVCKKKGVPVLWNYSKQCVVKVRDGNFRKQYFQAPNDTAHLNAAGHDLFLPEGEKFLKKLTNTYFSKYSLGRQKAHDGEQ